MLLRSGPTVAAAVSSLECRPARRCRSPVESEPVQLPASGTWPLVRDRRKNSSAAMFTTRRNHSHGLVKKYENVC